MADTVPIQIKWPRELAAQVRSLAASRFTTVSELTRQAVINQYLLHESDQNSVNRDTNRSKGESS